jgi:hypothetical protein
MAFIDNAADARWDKEFDVFLCHSNSEAEAVEVIGCKLKDEAGLRVWFPSWVLTAGDNFQMERAKGLQQSKTCAVFVGRNNLCGLVREEIEKALNRQMKERGFRVIPVILPNGDPSLVDDFLELRTYVDFKNGLADAEAFHQLVCGVRGISPGRLTKTEPSQCQSLASLKKILSTFRDLRCEKLIDEEIALEYQRRVLDEFVKAEKWK